MGTPDFAVPSLEAIVNAGHEIVSVVTVPDKPSGRGLCLQYSEVKNFALSRDLPVLQPEKMRDTHFIDTLRHLEADLFVVVAFRMLPEEVFALPPRGTFNVHASLLPRYRGAAPIQRAIMNGETTTGVTSFFLNKEMDKGNIIAQMTTPILEHETGGELYDRLKQLAATLTLKTIQEIETETVTLVAQENLVTGDEPLAPKIFKEDTLIDWHQPAQKIYNQIRALSPYPGAYTRVKTRNGDIFLLKCFKAEISEHRPIFPQPGRFECDGKDFLSVQTSDYNIYMSNVQLQGKARMEIKQFLPGFRINNYIDTMF